MDADTGPVVEQRTTGTSSDATGTTARQTRQAVLTLWLLTLSLIPSIIAVAGVFLGRLHIPAAAAISLLGTALIPVHLLISAYHGAIYHKVITFILGPDSDKFYRAAHEYWRQSGRTDVLVTDQRTLTEVLEYLNSHPSPNKRSWGQVNLVTHANEECGMGIKFSQESQDNLSPEELQDKITAGAVPKVDGTAVDTHTNINVHGCARRRLAATGS